MTATTRRPSTVDHVPPRTVEETAGIHALLGAFPENIFLSIPTNGEPFGRDHVAAAGHTDTKMSSAHVRFTLSRGQLSVEDTKSRNGTFLNGARLPPNKPVPVQDGAVLRLATTLFVYRADYRGPRAAESPLDGLVAPWGLSGLRGALAKLPLTKPPHNVLIEGATGVGKELLAPVVAKILKRNPNQFQAINVTSFPETMFDAQLFGWEQGAHSGATKGNVGVFRSLDKGSVFLDEIGELPPSLQPKLLRLLENREVTSIGAQRSVKVDLAVIGATNRSLDEMVESDRFREDLLARFPIRLRLPRLVERPEDLFAITRALWEKLFGRLDLSRVRVDAEAVEQMMLHAWPANVRDVVRLLATVDPNAGLKLSTVQAFLGEQGATSTPLLTPESVKQVLDEENGNVTAAARRLRVDRNKIYRMLPKVK
ncbi:MAG: sigma 54-interacting transcriptional regulator [Polyangiaceae bacterium]